MKVHATDHGHNVRHLVAPAHSGRQAAHANQTHVASPAVPPTAEPPSDAVPQQVTPPRPDERDGQKVPGVVRLLEAGHFRGVADVRLRINFFDQLSARATASAQPVIQDQSGELIETLSGELDQLLDSLAVDQSTRQQIDGLVGEFNASVQAAVETFTGEGTIDTAGLGDALRSAFDTLLARLGKVLTTPVPQPDPQPDPGPAPAAELKGTATAVAGVAADRDPSIAVPELMPLDAVTPVDLAATGAALQFTPDAPTDTVTDDPQDEPSTKFEDALAALTQTFSSALAALLNSIQSATHLPDPSPPNGNGVAYGKFLAIYNEFRGLSTNDVDTVG